MYLPACNNTLVDRRPFCDSQLCTCSIMQIHKRAFTGMVIRNKNVLSCKKSVYLPACNSTLVDRLLSTKCTTDCHKKVFCLQVCCCLLTEKSQNLLHCFCFYSDEIQWSNCPRRFRDRTVDLIDKFMCVLIFPKESILWHFTRQ